MVLLIAGCWQQLCRRGGALEPWLCALSPGWGLSLCVGVKGSGSCHVLQCVANQCVSLAFRVPSVLAGVGLGLGSIFPPALCLGVSFWFPLFPCTPSPAPPAMWVFFSPFQLWLIPHGAETSAQ